VTCTKSPTAAQFDACCGRAAVILRWNELPRDIQRQLFDEATAWQDV
jgi:hypothetical protein